MPSSIVLPSASTKRRVGARCAGRAPAGDGLGDRFRPRSGQPHDADAASTRAVAIATMVSVASCMRE
jgi:hypothetical protein